MPARSPATTHGEPKGPGANAARTNSKTTSSGLETQAPLLQDTAEGPQARHAALLDGAKLAQGVGDGQQARLFQILQRTYGNAHAAAVVAQLRADQAEKRNGVASPGVAVQREPAAACPAPPAPPKPAAPQQDPNFRAVGADVKKDASALKHHDPAGKKVAEAQGAAKPPADDIDSQAKAAKTEKMGTAKPGTFDKAAFMAAVRQAIAAKAPRNLDEADKFAHSNNADVKSEVTGKVNQGKEGAAKDVKQKAEEPPDPSKAKPKEVTPDVPEKPGARPADPPAANAMPQPAPAEQKDLGAGKCETDSQMKDADVTDEQLAKSNEPEFTGALEAKKEGEKHSTQAPAQVAQKEKAELEGAKKTATGDAKAAVTGMYGTRQGASDKVGAGKGTAKAKEEAERAKVSGEVKAIYDRAEADVKGILDGLDRKVDAAFDRGEAEAKRAFTQQHETEMEAYKDKRYSGLLGKGRWIKDKFAGLPEEANQIYIRARDQVYLPKMDKVISDVADIVGGELTKAKQRIEQGRAEIGKYVTSLPANLKKFGAEAQKEISSKFEELERSVDDKQKELVDKLATRYVEARNKVDDEIKAMQEANKGLWDKVKNAVAGVIKTILELKDMLMNVLAKAASVIGKIIKDPIGFLGNLIAGIKGGLQAFLGKIAEHMKKGVVGWLLGAMQSAGLELPAKFDIKGIIGLVASLLGLTWAAIRGRVVSRGVPDQAITAAEKAVPEAEAIKNEGIAGLWQRIKAKIGDVKEMILGKLKDFLIPTVITAGIMWVISLLNPASAFVKAVKAIIDIVKFIFERGAQLVEFVNTVLDAIVTIAGGAIGGAVHAIEGALAKSIPVLIGFLAALLGIGGLADKVKSIFQAITKPVMKVVDWVVDKIVKLAKKLWAKLKGAFSKKGKKDGASSAKGDPQRRLRDAVRSADQLMQAPNATTATVRDGLGPIRERFGLASLDFTNSGGHEWKVIARINPDLPSDSRKVPSPEELTAIRTQSARIAQLWRLNGVDQEFRRAGRAGRRELILDSSSYRRPGGVANAPQISVGDLVEATAEPGLRRIAASVGGLLLVNPTVFLADASGQPLEGQVDELDFLLLGPAEVRVVSAKTDVRQFQSIVDRRKLNLIQSIPDNPAAFQYAANYMGWGERARSSQRAQTAGAVVRCNNLPALRVSDFRSRYLSRERTQRIVIEPVHPKHQGEGQTGGHTLRIDLPDLIELYIREISSVL